MIKTLLFYISALCAPFEDSLSLRNAGRKTTSYAVPRLLNEKRADNAVVICIMFPPRARSAYHLISKQGRPYCLWSGLHYTCIIGHIQSTPYSVMLLARQQVDVVPGAAASIYQNRHVLFEIALAPVGMKRASFPHSIDSMLYVWKERAALAAMRQTLTITFT